MNIFEQYRLRLRRRRWQIRALRKRRELTNLTDHTNALTPKSIVVLMTLKNEYVRLPYVLKYYRDLGVDQFLVVDNDSIDGTTEYLSQQPDVSLWHTKHSYKNSRFGIDWITWLQFKYCHNLWTLVIDPDEIFVYPYCDTRPLPALTAWLDESGIKSFPAILLDMYPKGPLAEQSYSPGQDPMEILQWFDAGNYIFEKNKRFGNLWIQGGPRARQFFAENPKFSPALNKIPLVKWDKKYCYESSTHMLLPRGLNSVYEISGGERPSGILLHTKFLNVFGNKIETESKEQQHYRGSIEYKAYLKEFENNPELWNRWSEKYINWRQLEILGLISKGNWT